MARLVPRSQPELPSCRAAHCPCPPVRMRLHLPLPHARPHAPRSIILENSGVAEPQALRDQFADAAAAGHPIMRRLRLDNLVTGARVGGMLVT